MTDFSDLPILRETVHKIDVAVQAAGAQLQNDLTAKAQAKKQRSYIDDLEDKVMASTAVAAAASGTPAQAKAMLAKARAKAMQAAAEGADTGALDSMVHQMEHLAKIAEQNEERKKHRRPDASAAVIPTLVALGKT